MDAKYGGLLTTEDVVRLYAWGSGRDEDAIREELHGMLTAEDAPALTFPRDEPLFLLRGKDEAAPFAIASAQPESTGIDYAQACLNAGSPEAHLRAVWEAAAAMRDWQAANPERVKAPD